MQTGRVTMLTLIGVHTQTYNYTQGYTVTLGHTHIHTHKHTECLGQLFLVVPGPQIYECRGVHPVRRVKVIISTCKSQELSRPKVQSWETPKGIRNLVVPGSFLFPCLGVEGIFPSGSDGKESA